MADFFRSLLGDENINDTLTPAMSGLYAIPADKLHFKSVFPHVGQISQFKTYWDFIKHVKAQRSKFLKTDPQGSVTFEGGMQGLINRLADILHKDVILNYQGPLKFSGNTIICTDAQTAAELLENNLPLISAELKKIQYQPISTTTVFYKREIKSLKKAFGVLIPREANLHSIGVLNNKAIFPTNYPNSIPYTFISLEELDTNQINSDLKKLNQHHTDEDIEHVEMKLWQRGLPLYDVKRYLAIRKLHDIFQGHQQLALFGNYVAGISLREMISAAKNFAALYKKL